MRFARVLFSVALLACLFSGLVPSGMSQAAVGTITLSPVSGPPGSTVTVTGTAFSANTTYNVYFNGALVRSGSIDGSGNLIGASFTVPTGLPRAAYAVTVTTGVSDTTNPTSLTFSITPGVTLSVATGRVGDTVTVNGNGFGASSSIAVSFDSTVITTTTSDTTGTFSNLVLTIPATTPGNHAITASDGTLVSAAATFAVTPRLTITPAVQSVGAQITLAGAGFVANSPISFFIDNVAVAASATADASGNFNTTFTIPPLSQASHAMSARDASGNTATANLALRAAITITPQTGPPGTSVQVSGTGFAAGMAVTITFNSASLATNPSPLITTATGTFTASFAVPGGVAGAYNVLASDGTNSATATFTVSAAANISPASGPVGTTITVNGMNFRPGVAVTIAYDGGQVTTANTDAAGSFSATFKAPASRSGSHQVTANDGANNTSSAFIIVPSAGLSAASGYVDGSVTVTGAGFAASKPAVITFDGIQVAAANADGNGVFSVAFKVPVSQGGSHQVIANDGASQAPAAFTVNPSASLSPASGYVDSAVTVKGAGFVTGRAVTIRYESAQAAVANP